MKEERAGDVWIAKIHTELDAVIRALPVPVGNGDGIEDLGVGNGLAVDFEQLEMNLVYVKSVRLERVIFDGPVLDSADFCFDHRLFLRIKDLLRLACDRDVKLNRAI